MTWQWPRLPSEMGKAPLIRELNSRLKDLEVELRPDRRIPNTYGDGVRDDTDAILAVLSSATSGTTIDGGGFTYAISSKLFPPTAVDRLTLKNCKFIVAGDVQGWGGASAAAINQFFTMEKVHWVCSGHTTTDRIAVEFTNFSRSTFRDVWVTPTAGKTAQFYGIKNTPGSAPYRNRFEKCYTGNGTYGWFADDAGSSATGVNSCKLAGCSMQPATGNTAIKIGRYSQNIMVDSCIFESSGGTGIDCDAVACTILANRFESLTTGISLGANALGCIVLPQYWSSVTTKLSYAGSAQDNNAILGDDMASPTGMFWPGLINATGFSVGGTQVVGAQQSTVADPTGGGTQDTEARAAIAAVIDILEAHGLAG